MKAIRANPDSIATIFSHTYLIPKYQRKYTWKEEECQRLWDDFMTFHHFWLTSKKDKYFLGSITVWRNNDDQPWEVIDGQQRLITLSMLLKSFLDINPKNKKLMRCLFQDDLADGEVSSDNALRLTSKVIEDNNKEFEYIIRSNDSECKYDPKSQMGKNYNFFSNKVADWANEHSRKDDSEIRDMLVMLTNNIQLLRIESESMDDALHIFETLNDRGKPLDDTDILKVQLYSKIAASNTTQRQEFTDRWNNLKDPKDLFSIYMQILRAKDGDYDTTSSSIRKFFQKYNRTHHLFDNWKEVMEVLEKIQDITEYNWNMPEKVSMWWTLLNKASRGRGNRTSFWRLPIYTFLNKHITERSEDDKLIVNNETQKGFEKLIIATVRFLVIKGINYKNSGVTRIPSYHMCVAVEDKHKKTEYNNGNYLNIYLDDMKDNGDYDKFKDRFEDYIEFKTYVDLLVYLGSCLAPEQSPKEFNALIEQKIEIEHILPKKWKQYEKWGTIAGWNEQTHAKDINKLGNLMLLEQHLNKAASNKPFNQKKEIYKGLPPLNQGSGFQDAIRLSKLPSDWTPDVLLNRDAEIRERILAFLNIK